MQNDHGNPTDVEVWGVYFKIEELETLLDLSIPDVRIEIATTSRVYEELAVIRRRGTPSVILGTLHKMQDDLLILTKEDATRLAAPGPREAYLSVGDAAHGIARLATR